MKLLAHLWIRFIYQFYKIVFWYSRKYKDQVHPMEMELILRTIKNIGSMIRSGKMSHRKYKMAYEWSMGRTYEDISIQNNCTRERVRQCVWRVYHNYHNGDMRREVENVR